MTVELKGHELPSAEADEYLDLLQKCLSAAIYPESGWRVVSGERAGGGLGSRIRRWLIRRLARRGLLLVRPRPFDLAAREVGGDWPCFGYTMVGLKRLENVRVCVEAVLRDGIPGDLIETGVWRGGTVILMKAVVERRGGRGRVIWAADSFEGLPPPRHPVDQANPSYDLSEFDYLKVPVEQVQENFARFGLLDENVRFLKGWFSETLPAAPIDRLSLLRLDGDMYESTRDALEPLYPKLSPGGFVIVDDYASWPGCRRAVDEYRAARAITAPLVKIDDAAVWWRKP